MNSNELNSTVKQSENQMSVPESVLQTITNAKSSERLSNNQLPADYLQDHWYLYSQGSVSPEVEDDFCNQYNTIDANYVENDTNYNQNANDESNEFNRYMDFDDYYKSPSEPENRQQIERGLAISDQQRENLMKRIMLLKNQQNMSAEST